MTEPRDQSSNMRGAPRARKKPGSKRGRRPGSALGPVSGAKAIATLKRQAEALRLRESGMDLHGIAEELGYADPSGAYRAIQTALHTILPEQTRDEYRCLEVARIDELQGAFWERAMQGDAKAAGVVLRCVAARSRLLGLELPNEVETRVRHGEPVHLEFEDVLDEESLAAAYKLRDRMSELSALRAGEIDVTSWGLTGK